MIPPKPIAPSGWHVPDVSEFDILLSNYDDEYDAYDALIEGGTSGLEVKDSGWRSHADGTFTYIPGSHIFLSSNDSSDALVFRPDEGRVYIASDSSGRGKSVRLVKDDPSSWTEGDIVEDLDGNIYNTVKIGNQVWTVQNWACTKYIDGTSIDNVRLSSEWVAATETSYCAYNNNSQNVFKDYNKSNVFYGRHYNWHAVNNAAGIAPDGVLMPSDSDWNILLTWLNNNGYSDSQGSALAGNADLWDDGVLDSNPDFGATGFNAFPIGYRYDYGVFYGIGKYISWWSADENNASTAGRLGLSYNTSYVNQVFYDKNFGFSVRMLVDPSGGYAEDGAKYTDPDGNVYDVIQIGTQFWLAQNWACTQYADGTPIPEITDDTAWINDTSGARCSYNNLEGDYVFK